MIAKGLESQSAGERNGFAYTIRSLDCVAKSNVKDGFINKLSSYVRQKLYWLSKYHISFCIWRQILSMVLQCSFVFVFIRQLQVLPGVQAGDWHGLCVTWQKEDGFFMVYYDGRLLLTGSDFNTGNPVSSKGIFTLGIGSQNGLYEGRLGHVNAWPLVLDHPHLAVLSSKCGMERGELVSWPEFRANDVSAVEGAACPLTGKTKLNPSEAFLSRLFSARVYLGTRLCSTRVDLCPFTEAIFVTPKFSKSKLRV